jgi:hypothetical protein
VAIIIIIIGGGLYWAQKTGRISLFAAFEGWPDVTPNDPFYEEMITVGELGWMAGYEDGLFYPDVIADRSSVVVGEVQARGDIVGDITCDALDPLTWPFTDVDCDHWAFDYIAKAKALGLIDGFTDGSFQPNQPAIRAEGVVFIVKAKEWSLDHGEICTLGDPSTYPFPDVACDHWAYDSIVVAKQQRIIFGYQSGNFEPNIDLTRRDLAVLLYRSFIQAGEELTISGTVTNSQTADPIPGASVVMVETNTEGTKLSANTDSTGAYQLRVVTTAGAFSIRASASGFQSQTQGVILDTDKTVNFSLVPVSDSEGVISGTVKDTETNNPILGASVTILSYENGSQLSDLTDSTGAYQLRVAATEGTFSVKASVSGYNSKTLSATLSSGIATLNFSLNKIASEPEVPGESPTIVDGTTQGTKAAATGAVLPVAMVLLGTILALFSLVYLLKTNKPEQSAQ